MGAGGKLVVVGAAFVFFASGVHAKHHNPLAVLDSFGATPAGAETYGGSNVSLGRHLAAERGWTGSQWGCLDELWTRESGWSNTAENPKSGAYGIAQALGHGPTNQYPAGPANPPESSPRAQVIWGLAYVADRYGTPCGAWAHEEADSWY